MKRRQFLQAAGLGLSATAVTKPAIAQSIPEQMAALPNRNDPALWPPLNSCICALFCASSCG
jgi:hypothetical protein